MSFLYPQFLYAFGLLAIPIVIHFFNFRRYRKVEFTNVQFLEKAQNVKRSFNRLRNLIILFLRMLAISCLVLAFAQPVDDDFLKDEGRGRVIGVYVDNSMSTLLKTKNGAVLDVAKRMAESIGKAYRKDDEFFLLDNENQNGATPLSKQEFLEEISLIQHSPEVAQFSSIHSRYSELVKEGEGKVNQLYLISDFQKSTSDVNQLDLDSNSKVYFVPVQGSNTSNLSIDSAWTEQASVRTGQSMLVKVRVVNYSQNALDQVSISLNCNGKQRAIGDFEIGAGESKLVDLSFKVDQDGWNEVSLSIEDYPVDFDNTYYFSFHVRPTFKVLSINYQQESKNLKSVFETDAIFNFRSVSNAELDYSQLSLYDLIILNGLENPTSGLVQELLNTMSKGGSVLIIPGEDLDIPTFNTNCSALGYSIQRKVEQPSEVKTIQTSHPFLQDVFEDVPRNTVLPKTKKHFVLSSSSPEAEVLLAFGNRTPFLTMSEHGKGYCYVLSSNLSSDWTDFTKHALFVPVMYKTALFKKDNKLRGHFINDEYFDVPISAESSDNVLNFKNGNFELIPDQQIIVGGIRVFPSGRFAQAGFYDVFYNTAKDSSLLSVGINYSRLESKTEFYQRDEIEEASKTVGAVVLEGEPESFQATILEETEGTDWWKLLLYATLVFIILEIITIRFFRIFASR